MAKTVKPSDLGAAIEQELTVYHESVTAKVDEAGAEAVKKLAKITKSTAPEGARGKFRRSITSGVKEKTNRGNTYAWYVKPPESRLTHLLARGHATKNGGRTKADPFLQDACDQVLPEYETAVEEAVKG